MTDVVFRREMLPLGEFLKINLNIRVKQKVFELPEMRATDIKMNDETDEF